MQQEVIYCNKCGKVICQKEVVEKVDYVRITKSWGYFSNKDGICQRMNICEVCFDEWVKEFQIPPFVEENTELL